MKTEQAANERPLMVDVAFHITGGPVPLDHGYPLFGALCRALGDDLHSAGWLAVHPLRGAPSGTGKLTLRPGALLVLRIDQERIGSVLPLCGKSLEIAGSRVQVGVPRIEMLRPATSLVARTVTFKHHLAPETFLPHLLEELRRLEVRADVELGRRRIVTIGGDKVVGFGLSLSGLEHQDALRLQERGLGGRRHFGCGVFVPAPPRSRRAPSTAKPSGESA